MVKFDYKQPIKKWVNDCKSIALKVFFTISKDERDRTACYIKLISLA